MGRLSWLLLVLVVSVPGYLFLGAAPSRDRAGQSPNHTTAAASALHARRLATRPLAALPVSAKTSAHAANPTRAALRAGLPGNPQRPPGRLSHAAPLALAMLRLPSVIPATTIRVPILMYHHVSSIPAATTLNYGLTVTDADFTAQLTYLRDHGYHTVGIRQVFAALYGGHPLPAHPVMLTFDDGYLDNYTDALPILRRFHDHAEFNIISAYVGQMVGINSYMTWPQLRQLVAAGMDIGSHTVDHQDLGTLPVDKVRFELRDSRNTLQQMLHVPVQWLAYPSGEPFLHGSAGAQQLLLSLLPRYGYVGALLDGPLTTSVQNARAPFQLERIRVAGGEGLTGFAAGLLA